MVPSESTMSRKCGVDFEGIKRQSLNRHSISKYTKIIVWHLLAGVVKAVEHVCIAEGGAMQRLASCMTHHPRVRDKRHHKNNTPPAIEL